MNQAMVLDLGSGLTKAGFAGGTEPVAVIGSVVGTPTLPRILPCAGSGVDAPNGTILGVGGGTTALPERALYRSGTGKRKTERIVGERLRALKGVVSLSYPLKRGCVVDWEGAETLWRHVTEQVLQTEQGGHAALVTENVQNGRRNREKMAKFFFESLSVPALYIATPPVLALYASGRTSGVVLDVGDAVTTALAVVEGRAASAKACRIDLAGRDVSDRLALLMRASGAATLGATSSEREAVRRAKERLCYIARDPTVAETKAAQDAADIKSFELPDGNQLFLGAERFRAPEILFRPSILGMELAGVAELVESAIHSADIELRKKLYGSILLAVRLSFYCCYLSIIADFFVYRAGRRR